MATSTKAVYAAIIGNTVVMFAKFGAFLVTGSGAMMSEAIHSAADVANQSLLALGIARSKRVADADHPYGYAREQFIWALISAVGIFFIGCGATLYHGITSFLHPHGIEDTTTALYVLLFALVVEGYTLLVAVQAVRKVALDADMPFFEYLLRGPDPMGVAVVLEDGAAVLGVLIAMATIGLVALTGEPRWDAVGSILIGLLLGGIAVFLVQKNRAQLVGKAVDPERREKIMAVLNDDPVVEQVLDVKTTVLGTEQIRFKAEVEFDGEEVARRYLETMDLQALWDTTNDESAFRNALVAYGDHVIQQLGDEVDRIEQQIRDADPKIKHVDLESN